MRVDQGDDCYFDLAFASRTPPVDLTVAQSLVWRAKRLDNGVEVLNRDIGNGITVVDAAHALLTLPQADTAIITTPLQYELELVEQSGQKSTADKGIVQPTPDL